MISKKQQGITLVEIFLVLMVGGAIIVMSMRQYQSYRRDAEVQQVRRTVDSIFQAAGQYFHANCNGSYNKTTGIMTPGALNPLSGTLPNSVPVSMQTDLIAGGFLTVQEPLSPILVQTGNDWTTAYIVQFNKTVVDRNVCIQAGVMDGGVTRGNTTAANCTRSQKVGTIVMWIPQVSVAIQASSPVVARDLMNELVGDCLSTASSGTVAACTAGSIGSGNYVVFSRAPSFSTPELTGAQSYSLPGVRQFSYMYSTYQITYLTQTSGGTATDTSGTGTQYYLCGS